MVTRGFQLVNYVNRCLGVQYMARLIVGKPSLNPECPTLSSSKRSVPCKSVRWDRTNIKVQLTQFLRDKNPSVRQIALANLLGQTPKGSPHRDLFYSGLQKGGLQVKHENDIVRDIKILCRDQLVGTFEVYKTVPHAFLKATAHDAFRALINLSDNSLLIGTLSEPTFMKFIVSYILVSGSAA